MIIMQSKFERIYILQQPVDCCSLATAISYLEEEVNAGNRQFIIAQNPEKVLKETNDQELAEIVNDKATLLLADGVGLQIAARILNLNIPERVTGIELFTNLLALANEKGYTVFLYGAKPETLSQLLNQLHTTYPDLQIVGAVDGYTTDEAALLNNIRATQPDLLFVALGSPAQEKWLAAHLPDLPVKLAMGVGGSFDVLAGNIKRAPLFMQRAGLEWLYRLLKEPSRLTRTRNLPIFIRKVYQEKKSRSI